MRNNSRLPVAVALLCAGLAGQEYDSTDPKQRVRAARSLNKSTSDAIPKLAAFLKDESDEVRIEAVRSIIDIGTQHSLDPLIAATRDNNPEIQIRATDGIVNFYIPGYVQSGLSRMGSALRSRFDRENTQIVDPYVAVRPEAIAALGRLARGGAGLEVRANAARAIGILRGSAAVPDLLEGLKTRDDYVMFESLIALQKIRDKAAGPRVTYLMRDLNERVQIAAIETVGLLRTHSAVADIHKVFEETRSDRVRRTALTALSMIGDPSSRSLFQRAFADRNDGVRAAAAEGFARLKNAADKPAVQQAFAEEKKMGPRLALAFAMVSLGNTETGEFAPLTYLVNALNSRAWRNVAEPYLTELSRSVAARNGIAGFLRAANREEKIGIARVLASSGDRDVLPQLEWLTKDADPAVAEEGIRALRTLRSQLQ